MKNPIMRRIAIWCSDSPPASLMEFFFVFTMRLWNVFVWVFKLNEKYSIKLDNLILNCIQDIIQDHFHYASELLETLEKRKEEKTNATENIKSQEKTQEDVTQSTEKEDTQEEITHTTETEGKQEDMYRSKENEDIQEVITRTTETEETQEEVTRSKENEDTQEERKQQEIEIPEKEKIRKKKFFSRHAKLFGTSRWFPKTKSSRTTPKISSKDNGIARTSDEESKETFPTTESIPTKKNYDGESDLPENEIRIENMGAFPKAGSSRNCCTSTKESTLGDRQCDFHETETRKENIGAFPIPDSTRMDILPQNTDDREFQNKNHPEGRKRDIFKKIRISFASMKKKKHQKNQSQKLNKSNGRKSIFSRLKEEEETSIL